MTATTDRAVRRDPYLPYRRTMLSAQQVRELSRRRPARAVRDAAICWALIVGSWVGAAAAGAWWAAAVAFVVVGNRFYALFIIGHDGMHGRLSGKRWLNDLMADLCTYAPIGAVNHVNNRNHLRHHQYLASDDDPDRHKHACSNKATRPQLLGYLTAASTATRSISNVFLPHRRASARARSSETRPRYTVRDLALIGGWQIALFAGLWALFGWWWAYFVLWWGPVFVFMFLADNLRTFVEHSQLAGDTTADEHRLVTNCPGWLERQLLAPMNMNYHAAHHLWPSIPYYNLPRADAAMKNAPGAEAISWRGSYIGYLVRYYRAVPIAGCGPQTVGA